MAEDVTGGSVILELGTAVSYLGERCCLEQLRLLAIDVAHMRGMLLRCPEQACAIFVLFLWQHDVCVLGYSSLLSVFAT